MSGDGFSWSGTLEETDIQSIYGACHNLRFSGWLDLKDATHEARVLFLGGDPVEISGGDTEQIALWRTGRFRAVQKIPDFEGELINAIEMSGLLLATKPSALWAWISQYRLTCEIELERPGSRAMVTFQNGHAESAEVNGMPELAALARVSSWTDGSFRVQLRPLFSDGVVVAIPSMPDSAPSDVLKVGAKQFDVSRSVPLSLAPHTPWPGERAESERVESTAKTRTGSHPKATQEGRGMWMWLAAAAVVGMAAGVVTLYHYRLPPFSPPPKPILEPPLLAVRLPLSPSPSPSSLGQEPAPTVKVEEPPPPPSTKSEKSDDKVEKLVQKGRLYLITGHARSALDSFKKAEKLRPKDASLKVYQQQALGKLGHAELVLEGKGSITIDGKKFSAPKKLKLAAGPHAVDSGDGASEIVLKRGEKKKLRLKR
jgi:hypothetical protein